eukprot:g3398.t1
MPSFRLSMSKQPPPPPYGKGRSAPPSRKGALIVTVGQGESLARYDEIFHDLVFTYGYHPIFAMVHRGQGESGRLISPHLKGYVERFDDFVNDFRQFVGIVRSRVRVLEEESISSERIPLFLLCHSMGCAVMLRYLTEEHDNHHVQQQFAGLAAIAPLIRPVTKPFSIEMASAIGKTMKALNLDEWYAPSKEFDFEDIYCNRAFLRWKTTSSLTRWLRNRDRCVESRNELVGADRHEGLCGGSITVNLANEIVRTYFKLRDFIDAEHKKLSIPIIMQSAGSIGGTDHFVDNAAMQEFCETSVHVACEVKNYPNSGHSIWNEIDRIRDEAMRDVDEFFARHTHVSEQTIPRERPCNRDADCGETMWCDRTLPIANTQLTAMSPSMTRLLSRTAHFDCSRKGK